MLLAAPTQQDVFKSISDNVGNSADPRTFYIGGLAVVALVLLLIVVNSFMKRKATPRAVNHQGKLIKEMLRRIPLRKTELKQLKSMAAEQSCASPLTLILCPSLLAKGMTAKGKSDKRILVGVAKKMGILKKK